MKTAEEYCKKYSRDIADIDNPFGEPTYFLKPIDLKNILTEHDKEIISKIDEMKKQQEELSKIFDTEEWWYSQRTGEPFSNKVTRALTELKQWMEK